MYIKCKKKIKNEFRLALIDINMYNKIVWVNIMNKEEMFKKTLREEIIFFRSQTKEEILNTKFKIEIAKKDKYDLLPEDKIEEYIEQSYLIYRCYEKINEKLANENNNKTKKELIETSIIKVEESDNIGKEKVNIFKNKLKEFAETLLIQISPIGMAAYFLDVDANRMVEGSLSSAAAIMFFNLCIGIPLQEDLSVAQLCQQDSSYRIGIGIIVFIVLGYALYDIGLFTKKMLEVVLECQKNKKDTKKAIELLQELGIYDIVKEKQMAEEKIQNILNKGLVR